MIGLLYELQKDLQVTSSGNDFLIKPHDAGRKLIIQRSEWHLQAGGFPVSEVAEHAPLEVELKSMDLSHNEEYFLYN